MELFLWDLELFLQIQKRLGKHIVLKGGAGRLCHQRAGADKGRREDKCWKRCKG